MADHGIQRTICVHDGLGWPLLSGVIARGILPLPALSSSPVDIRSIMAFLVLAALIGVAWLQTENQPCMR